MGGGFSYGWADAPDTAFDLVSPGRGRSGFAARVAGRLDGAQSSRLTVRYRPDRSPVDLSSYGGIRFWVRGTGSFRFRSLQPTITDYDDYNQLGVRFGAFYIPNSGRVYVGGGAVYDKILNCGSTVFKDDCDEWYPEIAIGVSL